MQKQARAKHCPAWPRNVPPQPDGAALRCALIGKIWLCHRKWLMLFSLKFQRTNRQNALAIGSAKGKAGKKLYVDSAVAMKRAHAMTEPYAKIPRDGNATRDFVFGAFRTAS